MTPNKAAFSTGAISTLLIGGFTVFEKYDKVDAFIAEISNIFIPFGVALVIWLINRVLLRIEPYSDEQIKERSRCENTIKILRKALKKNPTDSVKETLDAQLCKQYEKLSSISLKKVKS